MGYRRRHRSRSRDGSPERSSSRPTDSSTQQYNVTSGEGDETSGHRTSSSRHHHRSQRHHHHSERPRRRRERPEWLKMILRAQRQFVWAILMTVGLCLKRGAQFVSDMLLGAPTAAPIENRPQPGPSGADRASYSGERSSSSAVATRAYTELQRSASLDDDLPPPNRRAIVAPEELD
uniref:Uncharacterized protein n=1 Tax=Anopheles culicifacies TaxID=139723 RepID=A0A182LSH4_9DIPT